MAFIRRGQLDDTFRIAGILVDDADETVSKAVGWMLREAGKRDLGRLVGFLDRHHLLMPRVSVRYATEHLEPSARARYVRTTRTPSAGSG